MHYTCTCISFVTDISDEITVDVVGEARDSITVSERFLSQMKLASTRCNFRGIDACNPKIISCTIRLKL